MQLLPSLLKPVTTRRNAMLGSPCVLETRGGHSNYKKSFDTEDTEDTEEYFSNTKAKASTRGTQRKFEPAPLILWSSLFQKCEPARQRARRNHPGASRHPSLKRRGA